MLCRGIAPAGLGNKCGDGFAWRGSAGSCEGRICAWPGGTIAKTTKNDARIVTEMCLEHCGKNLSRFIVILPLTNVIVARKLTF
jgi:hypothetical protein